MIPQIQYNYNEGYVTCGSRFQIIYKINCDISLPKHPKETKQILTYRGMLYVLLWECKSLTKKGVSELYPIFLTIQQGYFEHLKKVRTKILKRSIHTKPIIIIIVLIITVIIIILPSSLEQKTAST